MSDLPPAGDLHVLMISLGDEVLTGWGDVRERHLEYAERIAHLHMIVYSPLARDLHTTQLSDHLTVYPTRSRTRPTFILDAIRLGATACHAHPINVITTQDPFTTGIAGWWLKRRFGIPLDVQNHSDFFDNPYWIAERPLRYGLFNRLGKWIVKGGDTHRVLNEVEKAKIVALGVEPERVVVLSTPVRLGRFTPDAPPGESAALRESLSIAPAAPTLLWVGRPGPVKRVEMLVEAFAAVHDQRPDARLILVGDFSARDDIRQQIARLALGDAVCFPGEIAHEDLPAYYRLADLYVHSSVYEGLGKVLIEAAACGVPAVSTHTAGAAAIILDGETGILTPLHDAKALADGVLALLNDPTRRQQMGEAARAHVLTTFDQRRNLDAVVETWRATARYNKHADRITPG